MELLKTMGMGFCREFPTFTNTSNNSYLSIKTMLHQEFGKHEHYLPVLGCHW